MTDRALTVVVCAAPLAERAPEFAAALADAGLIVSVVATPAASGWIYHEEVTNVTGAPAATDYRSPDEPKRGPRPDVVVVAPATFNTLNKLAAGISDTYALGVVNEGPRGRHPDRGRAGGQRTALGAPCLAVDHDASHRDRSDSAGHPHRRADASPGALGHGRGPRRGLRPRLVASAVGRLPGH